MADRPKKKLKAAPKQTPQGAKVKALEEEVYKGPEHANNIVDLLELAEGTEPKTAHASTQALCRVFLDFMEKGELGHLKTKDKKKPKLAQGTAGVKDAKVEFREWLHGRYLEYTKTMLAQLNAQQPAVQTSALSILMQFVEAEALRLKLSTGHLFPNTLFRRIVFAILDSTHYGEELRTCLVDNYVLKYDDVRFYLLKNIVAYLEDPARKNLSAQQQEQLSSRIFRILQPIKFPRAREDLNEFLAPVPTGAEEKDSDEEEEAANQKKRKADSQSKPSVLLSLKEHKHVFSDCWLSVLRLHLTPDTYKRVLAMLHKSIMPHLVSPKLLIDFLTVSYNLGGVISVLALNGLFVLMTEHNLDYPDFYVKLYALFDRSIFHVKYRDRFFHLCGLFLQSILLPSYLVAAFAKRLTRLALTAPPSGVAFVLPFVYNQLLAHPQCMAMIHRERSSGDDPFIMTEADPAKCRALESSLWELEALRVHYLPQLSTFAKVFSDVFKEKQLDVDEFLDQDYSTMLNDEMGKRMKPDIPTEFVKPEGLLGPQLGAIFSL